MASTLVAATTTFATSNNTVVKRGALFAVDHPIVSRFPDLFTAHKDDDAQTVEQATRAPGETSTARRAPKPQASASKAVWAAYAAENGVDVSGMTRNDIVARFN